MPASDETIDIALCLRDESGRYHQNTYLTLFSLFENTTAQVNVHIIHDETISHGRDRLNDLCRRYGHRLFLHHIPALDNYELSALTRHYNIASSYRLFIHELLEAEKVVYLDSDVIVHRNILDLFSLDIGERLFAGTRDPVYWTEEGHPRNEENARIIESLHLAGEWYVNAGVLLINLAKCRSLGGHGNIFPQYAEKAARDSIPLRYADQDIINAVCAETGTPPLILDDSFNYMAGRRKERLFTPLEKLEGHIVHYARHNPHEQFFPLDLLFWRYYADSPWGGDLFEQLSAAMRKNALFSVRSNA